MSTEHVYSIVLQNESRQASKDYKITNRVDTHRGVKSDQQDAILNVNKRSSGLLAFTGFLYRLYLTNLKNCTFLKIVR